MRITYPRSFLSLLLIGFIIVAAPLLVALFSNALAFERLAGRVTGPLVDAGGKAAHVARVRAELGVGRERVLVLGDGANDLPMMAEGGTSIAYHAKPVVREKADYALDYAGLDGVLNLFPER